MVGIRLASGRGSLLLPVVRSRRASWLVAKEAKHERRPLCSSWTVPGLQRREAIGRKLRAPNSPPLPTSNMATSRIESMNFGGAGGWDYTQTIALSFYFYKGDKKCGLILKQPAKDTSNIWFIRGLKVPVFWHTDIER